MRVGISRTKTLTIRADNDLQDQGKGHRRNDWRVLPQTGGRYSCKQRPDGVEIVASMKRAVLTGPHVAEWYETCFCPTPLEHERQTQYDFYFTDLTTQRVQAYGEIQGASLWSYMASKADPGQTPDSRIIDFFWAEFKRAFVKVGPLQA